MRTSLLLTTTLLGLAASVSAQARPVSTSDTQGTLKAFALTPVGDVEGLILADGIEVHVPPHLTSKVLNAVHVGEQVVVRGWRVGPPNFIVATSLTGQNGTSVVDDGPPPPSSLPPPSSGALSDVRSSFTEGRVGQLLHGPGGEVNGALLEDGTTLKFQPTLLWQQRSQIQPGQSLKVYGWTVSTKYGRVVDVQSIGDVRVSQAPPPPPGAAPPPPPGAAPAPPPPGAAPPPPPPPGAVPPPPPGDAPPR